jgi:prolyl-tRNA synthetase
VVLGNDGIGADMLEEMRLAYVTLRAHDIAAPPDTPWTWLDEGYRFFPEARADRVRWSYDHADSPWHVAFTPGMRAIDVVSGDGEVLLRDGLPTRVDIAEVRAGDQAPDGSGPLELARGIEIGHVFQLGRKYAEALGLQVLDENGKLVTVTMGSYGIGVTRLVAVLAEANRDDKGLIWPESVSPADIYIVAAGKDDHVFEAAEKLAAEFEAAGKTVMLDDRQKVSTGVKFSDAELIGVPNVIICGKGLENGEVDFWNRRSGDRRSVPLNSVVAEFI